MTFSRPRLAAFLACQRRFQLRYREELAWPLAPLDEQGETARVRGEQFHQLLHRHFLGLPISDELIEGQTIGRWWQTFKREGPTFPKEDARLFPELSMTVPIGKHLLIGRFDLLILGKGQAHLYDWKTDSRPRSKTDLVEDLQTRLYLALAVEGGSALEQTIDPDNLSLTYWYVNEPSAAVTIQYSEAMHRENWDWLESTVQEIENQLSKNTILPLTDDLSQCVHCAYQIYCGRQSEVMLLNEWETEEPEIDLAPPVP